MISMSIILFLSFGSRGKNQRNHTKKCRQSDISKLSQISLTLGLVKLLTTISKYHSWYLCQKSLLIMLLPILIYWDQDAIMALKCDRRSLLFLGCTYEAINSM